MTQGAPSFEGYDGIYKKFGGQNAKMSCFQPVPSSLLSVMALVWPIEVTCGAKDSHPAEYLSFF